MGHTQSANHNKHDYFLLFCQVHGLYGAVNIVKLLKSRGVKLLYVLDEGLTIIDGIIDGLDGPAAL